MADYELIALNEAVPRLQAAQSGDNYTVPAGAHLKLPQENDDATPTLSFGTGVTGIFAPSDSTMQMSMSGISRWSFTIGSMGATSSGRPAMANVNASAIVPTVYPNNSDVNTGMGWNSADNLSLIAGGLEGVRVEDPADLAANETSLWVYDDDGNAMYQVKAGANGSGSLGSHRMLQIANA